MSKIFVRVFTFLFAVQFLAQSALAEDKIPNIGIPTSAEYALMMDYNSGEILLAKNANEKMFPSSMTKLMTAYVVFDAVKRGALKLSDSIPISKQAWKTGGSKTFVQAGTEVEAEDLLRGIVIQSGNDASVAMAEAISGSEEAFAEDMNFTAQKLGLTDSHFMNASGLPNEKHYMSSRDLVKLAVHLYEDFPEYFHYFSEKEFTYNKIRQENRNRLLSRNIGADGLKTGFTNDAGFGMVATAEQNGRRLILVVNGLPKATKRNAEAERLLKHGFRDFAEVSLFKKGDVVETADVWHGSAKTVPLVIKEDVSVLLNRRESQQKDTNVKVVYNGPVQAPIKKDDKIGEVQIAKHGKVTRTIPLFAGSDVGPLSMAGKAKANLMHYILSGREESKEG